MDFTNINDPAGVSALLERLRASQAWNDLQTQEQSSSAVVPPEPQAQPEPTHLKAPLNNAETNPSVASLLSQLKSSSDPALSSNTSLQMSNSSSTPSITSPVVSSARPAKDARNLTFQQALPHLAQLSDDPAFVEAVTKMRREQNDLEEQLWEERQALHAKHEEKVKIAVNKASITGGLSERDANAMRQIFEDELSKFDRERVLLAWDGLISRQQAALEKLGVPAMFLSSEGSDRERQQRIIQVLENILGSSETEGAP